MTLSNFGVGVSNTATGAADAARRAYAKARGLKPPVRSGPQSPEQRKAIGDGNRGKKRTKAMREVTSRSRRGAARGPRSPETIARVKAAMQASLWKRRLTRPLNAAYRGRILPLVYGLILSEIAGSPITTIRIIDSAKEAFRVDASVGDRLVIFHEGSVITGFKIG